MWLFFMIVNFDAGRAAGGRVKADLACRVLLEETTWYQEFIDYRYDNNQ
jgi:hypothetical protein